MARNRLRLLFFALLVISNTHAFPQSNIELTFNINLTTPLDSKDVDEGYVATIPEGNYKGEAELVVGKDATENVETGTNNTANINGYPIIGILAQETSYALEQVYPGKYKSFIAASYVKFVEGGGARVVPIFIDKPKEYYKGIMKKVNGYEFQFTT